MKTELAKALIERGVINNNTRIIADCPTLAMGDMPTEVEMTLTVDRAYFEDGVIKFFASNKAGRRYSVPSEKIKIVDGMDPVRLAAAYDIKADGIKKLPGKKRGRKPKVNTGEITHGQD
jgi:hypothetical protein